VAFGSIRDKPKSKYADVGDDQRANTGSTSTPQRLNARVAMPDSITSAQKATTQKSDQRLRVENRRICLETDRDQEEEEDGDAKFHV